MTKYVLPICVALTLLVANPGMACSPSEAEKSPTQSVQSTDWVRVILGYGGSTGEGPSTFFMADRTSNGYTATDDLLQLLDFMTTSTPWQLQMLGFGGSTGDGPNTFFKAIGEVFSRSE